MFQFLPFPGRKNAPRDVEFHHKSSTVVILGFALMLLVLLPCGVSAQGQVPSFDKGSGIIDLPGVKSKDGSQNWIMQELWNKKGVFKIISESDSDLSGVGSAVFDNATQTLTIPVLESGDRKLEWIMKREKNGNFRLLTETVLKTASGLPRSVPVGEVVYITGNAFKEKGTEKLPLEQGSPIFQNNVIVTGQKSHIEIHLIDDTILVLGENSRVAINDYIFDPDGKEKSKLLLIGSGSFRVISGQIARRSPENFIIKSPLTTINIRGTDVAVISGPASDQIYVLAIGTGHTVSVADKTGTTRTLDRPGTAVGAFPGRTIEEVRTATKKELAEIENITPTFYWSKKEKGKKSSTKQIDYIEDREFMVTFSENFESSDTHWFSFPKRELNKAKLSRNIYKNRPDRYKFDAKSYEPLECYKCHDLEYDEMMKKPFIHLPVLKKDCHVCHVSLDIRKALNLKALFQYTYVVPQEDLGVVEEDNPWSKLNKVDPFYFKGLKTEQGDFFFIEAIDEKGRSFIQKIFLPEIETLWEIDTSADSLKITDVTVEEIKKEIFTTAAISWKTNKLARAEINYSLGTQNLPAVPDSSLGYSHRITLSNLKPRSSYDFSITARDLLDNEAVSAGHSLSTEMDISRSSPVVNKLAEYPPIELDHIFYRYGNKYLVKITSNQPVSAHLIAMPDNMAAKEWFLPEDHPVMTSRRQMNIDICHNCHLYPDGHVVNAPPKAGMVIPKEYPTLPDGRITCMSCHIGHSGDIPERVRKKIKWEMCVGCHKDKEYILNNIRR